MLLDRIVARYERRVAKEIARAMHKAAGQVEAGLPITIKTEHEKAMLRILMTMWRESMEVFAERLKPKKQATIPDILKDSYGVIGTDVVNRAMNEWAQTFAFQKITDIAETTRSDIELVVTSGITAGDDERTIARAISAVAPTKSASRAQTIARTESHAAANAGAQAMAESTGGEYKRVWVSSGGGRTRDSHEDANGQTVGMNERFRVGRSMLRYPGDPHGSPEEVINCRCAVIFELA